MTPIYQLSTPGSPYGQIQEIPAGDYNLTLRSNAQGLTCTVQVLQDSAWRDVTPVVIPQESVVHVHLPGGLTRLDARGAHRVPGVDVFAALTPRAGK